MPRVRLLVDYNSPTRGASAGDPLTVSADEAKRLIEAGEAEAVKAASAPDKSKRTKKGGRNASD